MRCVVVAVIDGDGRQRTLLSPTIESSQLERHSAPSNIGRSHLPPPPDVIQSLTATTASLSGGRMSNSGGEIPSVVSPVNIRRTAESSPRAAPRTNFGFARRTHKEGPTVDSPTIHAQQHPSPVHARHSATVAQQPTDKIPEDEFAVRDFPGLVTDNRCR